MPTSVIRSPWKAKKLQGSRQCRSFKVIFCTRLMGWGDTQIPLSSPFERGPSSVKSPPPHVQDALEYINVSNMRDTRMLCTVILICKGPEGLRTSEFPSTSQAHDSLRVIFLLQLLQNPQILTVNATQRGVVDRVIVISWGVLVQTTLLIGDEAPETSCTLGDGSKIVRIIRGVIPPEDDVHRGGRNSGITSPIGRVSRRELAM